MIAKTPNTFVIGAGPVATVFAGLLRRKGVPVLGLWARSPSAARQAGRLAGVAAFSSAPPDLLLEAEVVIVAVRDDGIKEVAQTLLGTGLLTAHHVLLHCSGSISAEEAFSDLAKPIGGKGVLHPLRAISDPERAMKDMEGTVFGIQGDARGLTRARDLAGAMGGTTLELSGTAMASYHAAAAMASNYVVALIDIGVELMTSAGMDEASSSAALSKLASGAAANVRKSGISKALTGPIRRGDADTIERHLSVLTGDAKAVYRGLGLRALEICRRLESVDDEKLEAIETLLGSA